MKGRAIFITALILCASRSALGHGPQSFRLAFAAPDGCSSAAEMTNRIVQISARARPADPIEPAFDVGAQVVAEGTGFMGHLRVRTAEGVETTRTVPAVTCTEAVNAMALIAAMVIDPDAVPPPNTPPAPTSVDASPLMAATSPVTPKPSPPTSSLPIPNELRPEETGIRAPRFWFLAIAEAGVVGAMAPDPAPDFAVGLGFADTRRALLAPTLRVSARWASSPDVRLQEGTASFRRIGARAEGCPVRVALEPVGFRPCLFVELGALRGDGSNAPDPAHPQVFWGALGATGRAETHLLGRLVLGIELGALFPFEHDTFYFDPTHASAHQVAYAGFVGSFDVGVRFL